MALLNPPELRPSVIVTILRYLAAQPGHKDTADHLVAILAPPTLLGADPQRDVNKNLATAMELGLIMRDGDNVFLAEGVPTAVELGQGAIMKLVRGRVLDKSLNSAPWRSQAGARDLTNALSWFLTFAPSDAPTQMEGESSLSANTLQTKDFGPRQAESGEDGPSNWPIGNQNRWNTFRRWACSLGFAWASPNGRLIPDPTVAVRDSLSEVFDGQQEMTARDFIDKLAYCVPVIDGGRYREFLVGHWERAATESRGLTVPLTDALERLATEGSVSFDDRADAPRFARADGSTFSHVRWASGR